MLNYVQLQDDLKNLSDDQIRAIAMNPANPMHGTMAVGELDRRQRMRQDMEARQASPMTTIAEQIVTGAPPMGQMPPQGPMGPGAQAAGPAAPSPQGQAPIGMADGGSVGQAVGLRELAALLRRPELESIEGSMDAAQGFMGEDPTMALRQMIARYRGGDKGRRRMDVTQLLASIGAGMMNSRRPDFLGAVGEGASSGVSSLNDMIQRRNEEERTNVGDETVLANMSTGRQNRQAEIGSRLYGMGREGIEAGIDVENAIANREAQLGVAQLYANRAAGGGGGGGGAMATTLRARATRASIAANAARQAVVRLRQQGYDENEPLMAQAIEEAARLAAVEEEAWRAALEGIDPATEMPDEGGGLGELVDPTEGAVDTTNNPAVRQGAESRVQGRFNNGEWDWGRDVMAAINRALGRNQPPPEDEATSFNPGSLEAYRRQRNDQAREDLGGYSVRRE